MEKSMLETALHYLKDWKLPVIPVRISWDKTTGKYEKKPMVKWGKYQQEDPTETEVKKWFSDPSSQIGIVCGKRSNLAVVDFDYRKMNKEQKEEADQLIPENFVTPTIKTISDGRHFWCNYPSSIDLRPKQELIYGVDILGEGSFIVAPPSESGNGNAYSFIIDYSKDKEDIPTSILNKYSLYKGPVSTNSTIAKNMTSLSTSSLRLLTEEGIRDRDFFHVANCMIKGGAEPEYIFQVLKIILEVANKNCIKPFTERQILEKIKSAMEREQRREINFAKEIRDWVCLQEGWFLLTDLRFLGGFSLQMLTRDEKKNIYVVMNRLCKERLTEKHTTRPGCYRKVETDLREIDITKKPLPAKDLRFPLEIEKLVNIKPKNIIVVWSGPDGGKSAFCFNFSMLNMHKHEIFYFSSEMGEDELVGRLEYFKIPMDKWAERVHFFERSSNFADVIKPNGINIIDYLEVHEDFSLVAKYIRDVWDSLDQGIALICVQSKYNADLPRGGEFALEKARLAISLVRDKKTNICRIKKAKNWTNSNRNPNGLQRHFNIIEGCKVLPVLGAAGFWLKDGELETIEKTREEDY